MAKDKEDNLKLLKFIVHFMGVVLILGIIFLFYLVFQRTSEKVFLPEEDNNCVSREFLLPEKGDVKSVTYEGNNITVVLEDDLEGIKTQKILIIDLCSYEVRHKVIVKP